MRFEGRGFASGANALFDGVPLASPRVNPKGRLLLAEVDASLVSTPGTHTVTVSNPDGSISEALTFTVGPQDPDLSITLSGNAVQEDSGLIFFPTLLTDSFRESSEILVWGRAVTAVEVRGGVQIEIPEGFVDDPAEIPITLVDKNGNLSNTELFFIVPKPAEISFLDPDTIEVGTDDVPMNVHGDFKSGAVVFLNDVELPTTEGKNGRLEVVIPGILRTSPAQLVVRVEQDGIQSQDAIFTVTPTDAPFIFSIAPIRIREGEHKPSVDVVGANFGRRSVATIDGQETFIRDLANKRLTIAIPDDLALGPHVVQVTDRDGNPTNSVSFEVVPDVEVTTLAGNGRFGFNAECVSADEAEFVRPRRMTFGPDGLLYIADQQNHAIRTLDLNTGQVCTVAGTGNEMGAPPTFSFPSGVAVDASGAIYVTENGNNVVRRIERSGGSITVSTFAGLFSEITNKERQKRFNSTRQGLANFKDASSLASGFRFPDDIVAAQGGVFYVADAGNSAIRRITRSGESFVVETIAGNGVPGFADGAAGNARFNTPTALALSADGNFLFVADTNNNRVRKVNLVSRRVSTVAGGGDGRLLDGPGGQATLFRPIGLALDSDGVLYVSEFTTSTIRRIDSAGNVTSLAGGGSTKLRDGPGITARFNEPRGLAINSALGILCIADYENFVIRKIALR
jgi:sugar lactone lactonase YvrE